MTEAVEILDTTGRGRRRGRLPGGAALGTPRGRQQSPQTRVGGPSHHCRVSRRSPGCCSRIPKLSDGEQISLHAGKHFKEVSFGPTSREAQPRLRAGDSGSRGGGKGPSKRGARGRQRRTLKSGKRSQSPRGRRMEKLGLRRLGLLRIFPSEAWLGSPGPPAASSGGRAAPLRPGRHGVHGARPTRGGGFRRPPASSLRPPLRLPRPSLSGELFWEPRNPASPERPGPGPDRSCSPLLLTRLHRRDGRSRPAAPFLGPARRVLRPSGGRATPGAGPRPPARTDGPGARQPERGRPATRVRSPADRAFFPRPFPPPEEPAGRPRRRGVPECSELTRRTRRPKLPPEAPPASASRGGAGGGAASARRGPGAKASRRARAAPPRAGRSPLERLAAGQRCRQEGGREPGGRRGGGGRGRRQARWRAGWRTPARAYQSPRRSDVPALHPDGDGQAHKRAWLGFSDLCRGARLPPPGGPSRLEICPVPAASTGSCGADTVK